MDLICRNSLLFLAKGRVEVIVMLMEKIKLMLWL